jgi:tRNA (mo5U34)-methyltransferase
VSTGERTDPRPESRSREDLLRRSAEIGWYHTLELAPGHVTRGMFDLRPYVSGYGLPDRMEGMRALDVGTWDGFWAFEMERRGASVVALDVDDLSTLDYPPRRRPAEFPPEPRGEGFRLARELLGSRVERVVRNIYEAAPEELGTFDLILSGSVLIHLRDQLLALERIAALTARGGRFLLVEGYDRPSSLLRLAYARYRADREADVVFWEPSVTTWKRMLWAAGFDEIEERRRFKLRSPHGFSVRHVIIEARRR